MVVLSGVVHFVRRERLPSHPRVSGLQRTEVRAQSGGRSLEAALSLALTAHWKAASGNRERPSSFLDHEVTTENTQMITNHESYCSSDPYRMSGLSMSGLKRL